LLASYSLIAASNAALCFQISIGLLQLSRELEYSLHLLRTRRNAYPVLT
jgi:hypothetical protein